MKGKIVYNPEFSVKKNAENNQVSVSAIRLYIKENGIDRKYDEELKRYKAVHGLLDSDSTLSFSAIAKILGYSINTVKKYAKMEHEPSKSNSLKLSAFDNNKQPFVIKSISYSQAEILSNILRLFVKKDKFDCDLTYSIGNFYLKLIKPTLKFDKYPQCEDVRPLDEAYNIPSKSLESIVVDLPFIVKPQSNRQTSKVAVRFNCLETVEELYAVNDDMLSLAYRLLAKNGYLIMKTMDVRFQNKQIWVNNYVQNKAKEIGFELIDTFILLAKSRPLVKVEQQHFARKFHSYFYVFQKR